MGELELTSIIATTRERTVHSHPQLVTTAGPFIPSYSSVSPVLLLSTDRGEHEAGVGARKQEAGELDLPSSPLAETTFSFPFGAILNNRRGVGTVACV